MSLSAIAQEVNLPRSTVQRLVTALEIEGMLDGKGPQGGTRLGPTVSSLLATPHADMVVFCRHQLKTLLNNVNAQSMVLETMVAEHSLRVVLQQGSQAPLHTTAGGKALLSAYDDEVLDSLFSYELPKLTAYTLEKRAELIKQTRQARSSGIAYARNEYKLGISSIAIVVKTNMGIYAFEVTLPDVRFESRFDEIKDIMLSHKEEFMSGAFDYEQNRIASSLGIHLQNR